MAVCDHCGGSLPPGALSCPSCRRLVYADELEKLAAEAKGAAAAGDLARERNAWEHVIALLPPDTSQSASVRARIAELAARIGAAPAASGQKRGLASLGIAGLLLLAVTKGKFLLGGLTKLSTLGTMLASMGLYWALYGWKFAVGFVLSIYVHEMGHVAALARLGIPATAPMFIPGFGAIVRMKAYPANPSEDARVGLAGPIGLGAAAVAAAVFFWTGNGLWAAIAHAGAWINLFNLIPIWQLDGGRGFHALTRMQRGVVLATAVLLWMATSEGMLLLIAMGAGYRLFTRDYPERGDNVALGQFVGLLAALCGLGFSLPNLKG